MTTEQIEAKEQAAKAKRESVGPGKAQSKAAKTEKVVTEAPTQAEAIAAPVEVPQVQVTEPERRIRVCKQSFDIARVEKSVRDAMAVAGNQESFASEAGFGRNIRTLAGNKITIPTIQAVTHLEQAGRLSKETAKAIRATHKLLDALEVLG